MTTRQILKKVRETRIPADDVWLQYLDHIGHNGFDVACYINDGVSIWPCGETVDGKENTGVKFCKCKICNSVRALWPNIVLDRPPKT